MDVTKESIKGGEFLIRETEASEIFIPEEFSEEQLMMAQSCRDFIDMEIMPNVERMDKMEEGFMENAMTKAGELGLLGISIPEEYDGLGMNFTTSMLMGDLVGAGGSFSTAYGAHTGIGTLPILYYGNEEQKKKYIPKLATGEWKVSYCLTEPDAGSDANSGKTKAVLSEDGKTYRITGQKMWISNAGFAELFIVFAKIEDDKNLTAFIVEKSFGGITMNEEENKLGIKGSSTRQVFFNDTPVPAENMLSDRGNGFKIAVNVLNVGRIKLGAGVLGGCRTIIKFAAGYAKERKQFDTPIAEFGAIKHKLAQSAIRTYVCEALCYRAGQNIDDRTDQLLSDGVSDADAKLKALEEFAVECAIAKIHGSEVLDYISDEGVQIYGGMGYSEEAPMARAYRDARITRIYEGTNEINRMLIVGMLVRRAMQGRLDLMTPAFAVAEELKGIPSFEIPDFSALFSAEKDLLNRLKKAVLMVAGRAVQVFEDKLNDEQEILMNIADMIIETYAVESVILRTEKLIGMRGEEACTGQTAAARIYTYEAAEKIHSAAKEAVMCFASTDELRVMLSGLKRFTKTEPINTRDERRKVADMVLEKGDYCF